MTEKIRGFGHVKEEHLKVARTEEAALLARYRAGGDDTPKPARLAAE